ncbi:MAG TPA: energy transducer TonB [Vicinamibacterales bacterium]|nr:energy transducer TonB [Vicinamibacterales bacterium]
MRSGSVLVSVFVHALILVAALIVPLVATADLPDVHRPLAPYVRVYRPADIPLPADTLKRPAPQRTNRPAPARAPDGILPEKPRPAADGDRVPFSVDAPVGEGLPRGFGGGDTITAAPPLPPPPPPPRPIPPQPVGGRITAPARVAYVAPHYPQIAQTARVQGDVVLEAIIGVDGAVQNLRLVRSASPLLNDAAIAAVREWRYTPTRLNGIPVPVVMTVTVSFRLR